jgi:aldehyde:ferredoxin oxidoreductase
MQPILKIDLSNKSFKHITLPEKWVKDYIGGASLAARILYDYLVQDLDPLSPQAPLLFMTGPLTGTFGPAVGRSVICARSPATKLWAESNVGGFWGAELRKAGYDGLLILGKADEPVFIEIYNSDVKINDARHLWGLDTYQTQTVIRKEAGRSGFRVASIGIAGEKQIPYSLVLNDHGRVAGRTGMGAVMGSKNLKAISVRGTNKPPLFDAHTYNRLRAEANRLLRNDIQSVLLRELGTGNAAEYFNYLEDAPIKYYQRGKFDEELRVTGSVLKDTILSGVSACHGCVIACGREVKLDDGKKRKGPEYETMVGFGLNLMMNDPIFATRMGELCDRYGLDSISLSNTIGLAFHLYERGVISEQETDGLTLTWRNREAIETLVHKTAHRDGFGDILAQGAKHLGEKYDSPNEAVQVNGLEAAYHDPRGLSGMALVYATSPRGACHQQSPYYLVDVGQTMSSIEIEFFPRLAGSEKAANVAQHQNWTTLLNSLVMCTFANLELEIIADLLSSATGYRRDVQELVYLGERGWNLKRLINIRLGLTAKNDKLPKAFLEPYKDADNEFQSKVPDIQEMLKTYYDFRQWNKATGIPTKEKLIELHLEWAIPDLPQPV